MTGRTRNPNYAMIHGRFQPFHVGHVEYLLDAASGGCEVLIVGITNPLGREMAHGSDLHRHLPGSNPYSYAERALMVTRTIKELGLRQDIFTVPFEIDRPESWGHIPLEAVQYVNILEEWDRHKAEQFRVAGFQVVELSGSRVTSGTEVRKEIARAGDFQRLVPRGTLSVLRAVVSSRLSDGDR